MRQLFTLYKQIKPTQHNNVLTTQYFKFYVVSMEVDQRSAVCVVAIVGKPHGKVPAPKLAPQLTSCSQLTMDGLL